MIKWERGKKLVGDGCGEKGGRKLDVQSIVFRLEVEYEVLLIIII